MQKENSEEFSQYLRDFKRLETKLRDIASANDNSPFYQVLDKVERINYLIKAKRSLILDLYALRNVFAHADREKYIAEVNQFAFDEIEKIIYLLDTPPKVGTVFETNVYWVTPDEITEIVLQKMKLNIFTHVPIYETNKFYGTFSESTLLSWLVDNIQEGQAQFYKKQIKDIKREYLFCEENKVDFIDKDKSIFDIPIYFDIAIKQKKRLGALLITENGKKDELPIGIITAWDLPRIDDYIIRYS